MFQLLLGRMCSRRPSFDLSISIPSFIPFHLPTCFWVFIFSHSYHFLLHISCFLFQNISICPSCDHLGRPLAPLSHMITTSPSLYPRLPIVSTHQRPFPSICKYRRQRHEDEHGGAAPDRQSTTLWSVVDVRGVWPGGRASRLCSITCLMFHMKSPNIPHPSCLMLWIVLM